MEFIHHDYVQENGLDYFFNISSINIFEARLFVLVVVRHRCGLSIPQNTIIIITRQTQATMLLLQGLRRPHVSPRIANLLGVGGGLHEPVLVVEVDVRVAVGHVVPLCVEQDLLRVGGLFSAAE